MTTNTARKKSKNSSESKIFLYLIILIVSAASLFFVYRQKRSRTHQEKITKTEHAKSLQTPADIIDAPAAIDSRMLNVVTPVALNFAAKDGFSTDDFQIKSALVTKSTNSAGVSRSTVTIKHKSARCQMVLEFVGQQTKPTSSNIYCK